MPVPSDVAVRSLQQIHGAAPARCSLLVDLVAVFLPCPIHFIVAQLAILWLLSINISVSVILSRACREHLAKTARDKSDTACDEWAPLRAQPLP